MRYRDEIGIAKLQRRLRIINKKLPTSGQRRGMTSFQISGITLVSFGARLKLDGPR
jgi:hypothetical protein